MVLAWPGPSPKPRKTQNTNTGRTGALHPASPRVWAAAAYKGALPAECWLRGLEVLAGVPPIRRPTGIQCPTSQMTLGRKREAGPLGPATQLGWQEPNLSSQSMVISQSSRIGLRRSAMDRKPQNLFLKSVSSREKPSVPWASDLPQPVHLQDPRAFRWRWAILNS